MRKINKCQTVPPTLRLAPIPTCASDVKEKYYKARDVREQLMHDQFSKCAYCECKLTLEYNDVEHYRPKNKYWQLGHDWSNLLYACPVCNRSFKKTHFPLENDAHRYNLALEKPLIINPCECDPLEHIAFNRYIVVPRVDVDGKEDPMGKKTIDLFHLNDRKKRPSLVEGRERLYNEFEEELKKLRLAREVLIQVDANHEARRTAKEIIKLCHHRLYELTSSSQPYSGMLIGQTGV